MQQRLGQPAYSRVEASLADTGFSSAVELLSTYAGGASELRPMLLNAEINGDLNMRLQYTAGMGLNSRMSSRIYSEILAYRRFPAELLFGTGPRIERLREVLGRRPRMF